MIYPSAIIFVNNDLTENVKDMIERQLNISETLDGYVFDNYVLSATYLDDIRKDFKRILVIRSFEELDNRNLADIVCFVKNGLIAIEENKFGPHRGTFPIVNLTWRKLGIF